MLIDFSDMGFESSMHKDLGYMKTRMCEATANIHEYLNSIENEDFKGAVKTALNAVKDYRQLCLKGNSNDLISGIYYDNKYELELTGLTESAWEKSAEISLQHSLDYILFVLSGCSIDSVRSMDNYFDISENILNLRFEKLSELSLEDFMELDPKLDLYLNKLIKESVDVSCVISEFFSQILTETSKLLNELVLCLRYMLNKNKATKGSLVIRSRNYCSYVVNCYNSLEDVASELCISERQQYFIIPRFYRKGEYLNCINKICSEVRV